MDNQPGADPQNQQNLQPTRRLFVYDRPHAVQRSASQADQQSQPVNPASQLTPTPTLAPTPQPAPSQPPVVSTPNQPPETSEPQPQTTPPESIPAPNQPPAPEDVALSHAPKPIRPQLPEHNFDQPDLVDLKPVWQVNLPDETTESEQPINQPYQPPKKRLWQKSNAEPTPTPAPAPPPSQPTPSPIPVSPPAPDIPASPAPIPEAMPQPTPPTPQPPVPPSPQQPPKPEDIALSKPTSQPLVAKVPDRPVFNNQFAPQPKQKRRFGLPKFTKRMPSAMKLMAAMVLVVGAVVSFNTFQAKNQASDQVASNPYKPSDTGVLGSNDENANNKTPAPQPSEEPLGDNFSLYRVEPGAPSKVIIPGINTDTRAFSVGVDSNNIILPPDNIFKIGWYEGSAQPDSEGVVILNGYIEGPSKRGALYGIETLKQGDKITIERGDGQDFTYTVQAVESYENDEIDMSKISTPYILGKKGLNIMTVGGRYNAETGQYEKRYAVFAIQD